MCGGNDAQKRGALIVLGMRMSRSVGIEAFGEAMTEVKAQTSGFHSPTPVQIGHLSFCLSTYPSTIRASVPCHDRPLILK